MLKGKDQLPMSRRYISCRKLMKKWVSSMDYVGEIQGLRNGQYIVL